MELKIKSVEIELDSDIINKLNIDKFLKRAGVKIQGYAKDMLINSPEAQEHTNHNQDTGALLRSILPTDVKHDGNKHYVQVGSNIEYAPYIEFGSGIYAENGDGRQDPWKIHLRHPVEINGKMTEWVTISGIKPSPFLRPALLQYEQEYKDDMKKVIG